MTAGTAWKVLIVANCLVSMVAVVVGPILFLKVSEAAEDNRATVCSIGRFLVGSDPVRIQGVTRKQYAAQLAIVDTFLSDLQEIDCKATGGIGKEVTPEAIEAQRRELQAEIKDQNAHIEGHGGTSPVPEPEPGQANEGRSLGDQPSSSTTPLNKPEESGVEGSADVNSAPPAPPATGGGGDTDNPPGNPPGQPAPSEPPSGGDGDDGVVEQVGGAADDVVDQVTTTVCNLAPVACPK